MHIFNRLAPIVVAVGMAGLCFAPIEGKPDGAQFHPELSQEQLGQYQGSGSSAAQINPGMTSPDVQGSQIPTGSQDAATNLANAQSSADNAAKSLAQANKDVKNPNKSGGGNMMLAGLFVLIGLGLAVGIKTYLDKSIPEAPGRKK